MSNDDQNSGIDSPGSAFLSDAAKESLKTSCGTINEAMKNVFGGKTPGAFRAQIASSLGDTVVKNTSRKLQGALKFNGPDSSSPNFTIPDSAPTIPIIRTNWQQLIILGNGFDLQCGLHSRFGDFFQPRFEIIKGITDNKLERWKGLVENSGLTLWDFILEANIDSPWCDVEGVIEEWVSTGSKNLYEVDDTRTNRAPLMTDSPYDHTLSYIDGAIGYAYQHGIGAVYSPKKSAGDKTSMYALTAHLNTLPNGFSTPPNQFGFDSYILMTLLKKELFKLEKAFAAYLESEVENNEDYADNCRDLYTRIAEDGKPGEDAYRSSTSVLSFNYTTQIKQCFDGGEDGVCVNIHGALGDEIIFGIDGKDRMDNPVAAPFTKTFRLMQRGGSRTDKLICTANSANLEGATDVIKFYGHSLGKADYSYFQSIFDGVDLYESKTVLVFYYPHNRTEGAEAENDKWRTNLANSVNGLLVAYGATLENKDHGKNLMHKLLLEGRLKIKGLEA